MSEPQPVIQRIRLRSDGPLLAVWEAIYAGQDSLELEVRDVGRAGQDVLQTIIEALTRLRDTRPGSYLVPAYRSVPIDGGDGNSVERLLLCTYGGQELATASEAHFSEEEVLRFANSHATLLAELHRAGFSGFRPQLEDIVWREDGRDWTFYGWEGVRRDTCYAVGDLGAAGRLWARLLLGHPAPSTPPLDLFSDLASWHRVSLGTRRLLLQVLSPGRDNSLAAPSSPEHASLSAGAAISSMQYWQYTPIATADELVQALAAWQSDWERSKLSPDELLNEAAGFEASQPQRAVDMRDLVSRQRSGQNTNEAEVAHASRAVLKTLLNEAKKKYQRANFGEAALLFSRLAGTLTLPARERLDAWRWYLPSAAFVSEGSNANALLGIGSRILPELQDAIENVDRAPDESAGKIGEQARKFSTGQKHLKTLQADFDMVRLCRKANREFILQPAMAEQLYWDASQRLSGLPASYQDALIAVYGDPQDRIESCAQRRLQKEELDGHQQAAEDAVKAGEWGLAELRYRSAASLAGELKIPQRARECAEFDRKACQYESRANEMGLRLQVERLPANATAEEILQADYAPVFAALNALLRGWPQNDWGEARLTAWRQQLQASFNAEPADWASRSRAGAALIALLPKDEDVNIFLSSRVEDFVEDWKRDLEQIGKRRGSQTPAEVEARIQNTQAHLNRLQQAQPWLASSGSVSVRRDLEAVGWEQIKELQELRAKQAKLRERYEDALQPDGSFLGVRQILRQARTDQLELYDEPTRQVDALPETSGQADEAARTGLALARFNLNVGKVDAAQKLFEQVAADEGAPQELRRAAEEGYRQLMVGAASVGPDPGRTPVRPSVTLPELKKLLVSAKTLLRLTVAFTALAALLGVLVAVLMVLRSNPTPLPQSSATPSVGRAPAVAGIVWSRPPHWTGQVGVGQAVTATIIVTHSVSYPQSLKPELSVEPADALKLQFIGQPSLPDSYRWLVVITGTRTGQASVVAQLPNYAPRSDLSVWVLPSAIAEQDLLLAETLDSKKPDISWARGEEAVIVGTARKLRRWKVRLPDGRAGWVSGSSYKTEGDLKDVPELNN